MADHAIEQWTDGGRSEPEFWEWNDTDLQLPVLVGEWIWIPALQLSGDELDSELCELVHNVVCSGNESDLSEPGQWQRMDWAGNDGHSDDVAEQPMHGKCGAIVEFGNGQCVDGERGADF